MPTNPRQASPRTQRKRPGDMTGTQSQRLAAAAAKAKEAEAQEEAENIAAERAEKLATTVSFVTPANDVVTDDDTTGAVEEDEEVEVRAKTEFIRVNFPIDDMTYGREVINPGDWDHKEQRWNRAPVLGNLNVYSFEEGVRYEVSKDMANHLRALGYVYEF